MARVVLFIFLVSIDLAGTSQGPGKVLTIPISGTVLAYSPFARLTILAGPAQSVDNSKRFHEDFLVRVDQRSNWLKEGQLVRLVYSDDTGAKPELPKELFTKKGHWIFLATRDDTCASNLENILYYKVEGKIYSNMQLTRWAKPLKPVNDTLVPCYVISSGGFAKQ